MTSIDKRIIDAVKTIVPDIKPNQYKGSSETYCVYNYSEIPSIHADSEPHAIRYIIQLHYYLPHRTNPNTTKRSISNALLGAGFTFPSIVNASDNEGQHYVFEFEGLGDLIG